MCRRCGAPDRRGNNKDRRRRARRLAEIHGNGTVCPCTWCGVLVSPTPGRLVVPARAGINGGRGWYLPILQLEQDRLMEGGPYALWNLVPSCPPCNKARAYESAQAGLVVFPDGCDFGTRAPDPVDQAVGCAIPRQTARASLPLDRTDGPGRGNPLAQTWAAIAKHAPDAPINAWPLYYGINDAEPIPYGLPDTPTDPLDPEGVPSGPSVAMTTGGNPEGTDQSSRGSHVRRAQLRKGS